MLPGLKIVDNGKCVQKFLPLEPFAENVSLSEEEETVENTAEPSQEPAVPDGQTQENE